MVLQSQSRRCFFNTLSEYIRIDFIFYKMKINKIWLSPPHMGGNERIYI